MACLKNILILMTAVIATAQSTKNHNLLPSGNEQVNQDVVPSEGNRYGQAGHNHPVVRVIDDIHFLNEIESCRRKNQDVDGKSFYNYLYCNLTQGQYTTATGNRCNFTVGLAKKIKERLNEFVVFKKSPRNCKKNNSIVVKRSVLDSDWPENDGIFSDEEKNIKHIYMGLPMFPITAEDLLYSRITKSKRD